MIDLHTHILPSLCDGSQSLETSLEMARIAVGDGITHLACTPHIYPPLYNNSEEIIAPAMTALQLELNAHNIPLELVIGADVHMLPEVMSGLKRGTIPTLNYSRYFLLEPSHHVPVLGFLDQIGNYLNVGYIPVITHPERLRWIDEHYEAFVEAAKLGAWIQLTAGAICGDFGKPAQRCAERFLADGYVHIIASDAHGTTRRPPILSRGINKAEVILGDKSEISYMVLDRPLAILKNEPPEAVSPPPALRKDARMSTSPRRNGWFNNLFR